MCGLTTHLWSVTNICHQTQTEPLTSAGQFYHSHVSEELNRVQHTIRVMTEDYAGLTMKVGRRER